MWLKKLSVPGSPIIWVTPLLSLYPPHALVMTETFVKSFTHLKDRPKAERALPFLQRVASLVKPIMRKHGWVLPVLSEFFPDSPNLVGKSVYIMQRSQLTFLLNRFE